MRDISELSDNEKLDLEYYRTVDGDPLKKFEIWKHFQKNPFSMDVKIDVLKKNNVKGK
jgi:hypothetical protein